MSRGEKETALYRGTLRLFCESPDFSKVTVQEIATVAGVGKGTVYEYFSSREELIAKAMIFGAQEELSSLRGKIGGRSFEEQWGIILDLIEATTRRNSIALNLFFANDGPAVKKLIERQDQFPLLQRELHGIFQNVLEQGEREGLFVLPEDSMLIHQAVLSAILGFAKAPFPNGITGQKNLKRFREISLRLLIKMLQ